MKKLYYLLILTLPFLSSCEDENVSTEAISVSLRLDQLNLVNNTDETLYYFVVDQSSLAAISWTPSVSESQPKIDPNGQARIPLSEITGYAQNSEVIVVNYWRAIIASGELAPGPVEQILFNLD